MNISLTLQIACLLLVAFAAVGAMLYTIAIGEDKYDE